MVFKTFLTFACIQCSALMLMFHEVATETRELAVFGGSIVLAIFTLLHVVALRFVSKQFKKCLVLVFNLFRSKKVT